MVQMHRTLTMWEEDKEDVLGRGYEGNKVMKVRRAWGA